MPGELFRSVLTVVELAAVGVFAVTGALVASRKEMDVVAFLWLGVITASLGGIIRDLPGHEPSMILREEIYVTAALLGALVYVSSIGLGVGRILVIAAAFSVALPVRGFALGYGWSLPAYESRPGRPQM